MRTRGVFFYGKFVIFGIIALAVFTYLVMLLWNCLVPGLFSGPVLTYWQTLGILVLSKIIFAGVGGPHKHNDHPSRYWKRKYHQKMNGLSEVKSEEAQV